MVDLEYKIGELKINPDTLRFIVDYSSDSSQNPAHRFLVDALGNVVTIYVAEETRHRLIAKRFNLDVSKLVGGGDFYLNEKSQLVLDDLSLDYGAIPKDVAQRFAELIAPELERYNIKVNGIAVNPKEKAISDFWKEIGFKSE